MQVNVLRAPRGDSATLEDALAWGLAPLNDAPAALRPVIAAARAISSRGGKRIRPRLCVLAYEGIRGQPAPRSVYRFAAGIELLHVFMLVHDDLVDDAAVRRGGPTVHTAIGRSLPEGAPRRMAGDLALLAGDLLFATAVKAMNDAGVAAGRGRKAMAAVIDSAVDAALGECLDVTYGARAIGTISSADLAEALRLKTARYSFVAPLVAGALLAGASRETVEALTSGGERLGIAFQLADDLLDLYASTDDTGKPVGGDLRQRKRTVLVRLAHQRADEAQRRRLGALLDASVVGDADVEWATALIASTGAAREVIDRVRRMAHAATKSLARATMQPAAHRALRALATSVVDSVKALEGNAG